MNKYRNKRTEVNGIVFDSKKEASRWSDLLLLQRAGVIRKLRRQVPYLFELNDVKICRYFADFVYEQRNGHPSWVEVVEDCKGKRTRDYILKKKMMRAFYGVEILET